ncbi:uncharacterized protein MYCGRDRAFT_49912, partial [Zymoseptoria tritici IPO323]
MIDSTPIPQLPDRAGVLEQGNVLTLRDQEAKLDQIQKDNFSLKLKIHYLEEALRKSGNEFHQATLKENNERTMEVRQLQRELEVAKSSSAGNIDDVQHRMESMKAELEREHKEAKQALEDEIEAFVTHFKIADAEQAELKRELERV